MNRITNIVSAAMLVITPFAAQATPEQDLREFREHFFNKFPDTPKDDFINGVYSIDPASREQWEAFEEFPSYEIFVDKGEELFNKPFANGKSFVDCFPDYKKGIRQNYPYFDTKTDEVVTLEGAINKCLTDNGEKPYQYKTGNIAYVSAYLAYQSRGNNFNVKVPNDPQAMAAYNRGKKHFYAKRGQLNMACADCHFYYPGSKIRADILSPALGHPTGFPVYRNKWAGASASGDGMGTLHRRYGGCNKQVRAKPFKPQSDEYKALEYFHTYMSNGLEVNGPSQRK
ncbi:MAG: sulfur oxidation c-type cytochrome SoxA [Gammaproteobacteria bacterium]|nr:sulfur oxidation c-type cytochrome SoxA [Gammaproteobacteria bacterium]